MKKSTTKELSAFLSKIMWVLIISVAFSPATYAQPGSLDSTFGTNGRIDVPIGILEDYGKAVAVQPDGKILIAGFSRVSSNPVRFDVSVIRVNTDGTLDSSFDGDGTLIITTGDIGSKCHAMTIQPDGKILLAGVIINTGGWWHFLVIRLNADGTFDDSFGVSGQAIIPVGPYGDAEAKSIAVGSNGKIVVVGTSSNEGSIYEYTGFTVVCLLSDGTPDGTFDDNGIRVVKLPPGANQPSAEAASVAIQADGKIVVAGKSKDSYNASDVATVLRLNIDGSDDTGFNGTGMGFFVSPGTTLGRFYSVVLQPDNKILLAGMTASSPYAFIKIMRLKTDGTPDTSFSGDGDVLFQPTPTSSSIGYCMTLQPDGKILVAGVNNSTFIVIRLESSGSPDNSFDDDGIALPPAINPNAGERVTGIALQSDGKIVLAGSNGQYVLSDQGGIDVIVMRLNGAACSGQDLDGDGYSDCQSDCDDNDTSVHPGAIELCNSVDDNCDGQIDEVCDADGDGYTTAQGDCNDANNLIHPGAIEVCNGIDDNCNSLMDDGLVFQNYYKDNDGDGYAGTLLGNFCSPPPNSVTVNSDCNDGSFLINPGATEVCNGLDDDCDGLTDDADVNVVAQTIWYADADLDGYGDAGVTLARCSQPVGYVANATDCDDGNNGIHSQQLFYLDNDGDGYGNSGALFCSLIPPPGYASLGDDCADGNINIHPGAAEICNGIDDDCNFIADDGIACDNDGDGYTVAQGDCDDNNINVNPGVQETCNGIDDDCDGLNDDADINVSGQTTWYYDNDGDGYGDILTTVMACILPPGYIPNSDDCDDNDFNIHDPQSYYEDNDGDSYGGTLLGYYCIAPPGSVAVGGDCNDGDNLIHPGAAETCNGIDDNCNFLNDDGLIFQNYYTDNDGDGYAGTLLGSFCSAPANSVTIGDDCNDGNNAIHPGAIEICNAIDDDCNSLNDDGLIFLNYYADIDLDGYGGDLLGNFCSAPLNSVTVSDDCNDNDITVHSLLQYFVDSDNDGYGTAASAMFCSPAAPAGYSSLSGDCNDGNMAIRPGANELCNKIDDNCDGQIDENSISATIIPAGSVSICKNTTITLTASGGLGIFYEWYINNSPIVGATGQTYITGTAGKYRVWEKTALGCKSISPPTTVRLIRCNKDNHEVLTSAASIELKIYPNPTSSSTTISFTLLQPEKVSIQIFDMTGRLVKIFADYSFNEGENQLKWSVADVPAGIYLLKLWTENSSQTERISVIK